MKNFKVITQPYWIKPTRDLHYFATSPTNYEPEYKNLDPNSRYMAFKAQDDDENKDYILVMSAEYVWRFPNGVHVYQSDFIMGEKVLPHDVECVLELFNRQTDKVKGVKIRI